MEGCAILKTLGSITITQPLFSKAKLQGNSNETYFNNFFDTGARIIVE